MPFHALRLLLLGASTVLLAACFESKAGRQTGKTAAADSSASPDSRRDALAELRDITDAVQVSGFVEPVNAPFEVRSEISGRIARIHVRIGDSVKKGAVLVEMDDTTPKADFDEASRNEQFALLQLEKAERDAHRQDALLAEGFSTERDALDARTAHELAKLDLAVRRARLAKAKDNLSRTIIFAPYDGIISDINVSEGQVVVGAGSVNSGTLLMKVNDFAKLQVSVKFNEFDAAKIALGKAGEVTFDSTPGKRVKGVIAYLSPFAISDQNQRVFPAKIALETGDTRVPSGVSANIRLVTASVSRVPAVPVSAVFIEAGDRHVYLKKTDGSYARTPVETGINDDGYIEIKSGLAAGDTVALVRPAASK